MVHVLYSDSWLGTCEQMNKVRDEVDAALASDTQDIDEVFAQHALEKYGGKMDREGVRACVAALGKPAKEWQVTHARL